MQFYDIKDELSKIYRKTHFIFSNGKFFSLEDVRAVYKKRRYAQYLNLIDTMNRFAADKSLAMAFITATLKDNRFDDSNVAVVKLQSRILRGFTRSIRDDKLFREPTEERRRRLRMKDGWYYISPERFQYIYTLEFQKDYTLHSHYACYIPDEPDAFINLYEVVKRKKDRNVVIGRTEFVVPEKYKEYFMRKYTFESFDLKKPDCFVEYDIDIRHGDFLYLKFINDEKKHQQDYYIQVMRYISKYVMKSIGQREDGKGTSRSRKEDVLIRYNKLKMISYSRTLVPFYIFNKFYKELKEQDIGLYDLTKMIENGQATYFVGMKEVKSIEEREIQFDNPQEYKQFIQNMINNCFVKDDDVNDL
ncbi:hypothetical protein OF66_1467 [Seleniivibrio woodruffii]|uniref:Uncharacterized protein n=1 Tax=Seleniivibrio woodruffii TaxID=1078050 RepID=A0A4R1K7C3_9BACT|nr:hypothetical protein C8D98_2099 [Seleniivibrio woodruffii]TVZ35849.1 hypothetical protein OF66_1467 [Seleniivibrio woodruffii]